MIMNAVSFVSAYRQLQPAERAFVDAYVTRIEREAAQNGERISNVLHRPVPASVVQASGGMLQRPLVVAAISERINDLASAAELSAMRILKEWSALAFSSVGDYMEIGQDGQPYFNFEACTPEQLSAIQSIEIEEGRAGRKFKFKLHDKTTALTALSKWAGLLDPDNPVYRQYNARPAANSNVTIDNAADAYSKMING